MGIVDVDEAPPITLVNTFDSSEHGDSSDGSTNYFETQDHDSQTIMNDLTIGIIEGDDNDDDGILHATQDESNWFRDAVVLYIAMGAFLGNVSRVYVGRLFGSDCAVGRDNAPDDFLAPFFSRICITNSGLTEQTGGALFLDLPANMIGSLVMGMLAAKPEHPFPWLHRGHHLQNHKALIAGFGTGFCGCLTTFASWNTQMIHMLDGTGTELGSQVPAALFGYVIGLCGAISCFIMGRHLHEWWSSIHPTQEDRELHAKDEQAALVFRDKSSARRPKSKTHSFSRVLSKVMAGVSSVKTGPPVLIAALTAGFLVGAIVYGIPYYEEILLETVAAPLGALLRWKLSIINAESSRRALPVAIAWIPLGTLAANIFASIVSAGLKAVQIRYLPDFDDPWTSKILPALETGFCGSLSTVSTFIKEIFVLETSAKSFQYSMLSLIMAMLLSLLVFSPMVRS